MNHSSVSVIRFVYVGTAAPSPASRPPRLEAWSSTTCGTHGALRQTRRQDIALPLNPMPGDLLVARSRRDCATDGVDACRSPFPIVLPAAARTSTPPSSHPTTLRAAPPIAIHFSTGAGLRWRFARTFWHWRLSATTSRPAVARYAAPEHCTQRSRTRGFPSMLRAVSPSSPPESPPGHPRLRCSLLASPSPIMRPVRCGTRLWSAPEST